MEQSLLFLLQPSSIWFLGVSFYSSLGNHYHSYFFIVSSTNSDRCSCSISHIKSLESKFSSFPIIILSLILLSNSIESSIFLRLLFILIVFLLMISLNVGLTNGRRCFHELNRKEYHI